MTCKDVIPFRELFRDTVNTHGASWAYRYYTRHHKMQPWEFRVWMRSIRLHPR